MSRRCLCVIAALVLAVSCTQGCATIIHGRTQSISISSDPPGARASVGGATAATTPAQVTLDRNKSYTVTFEKEGYAPASAEIRKTVSPWIFGNILIGGIPGIIVDLITGSASALTPETIHVQLQASGRSSTIDPGNVPDTARAVRQIVSGRASGATTPR